MNYANVRNNWRKQGRGVRFAVPAMALLSLASRDNSLFVLAPKIQERRGSNAQRSFCAGESPTSANALDSTATVSDVVTKALAFEALLTSVAAGSYYNRLIRSTLARKWSNFPVGATCRNGIAFRHV